MKAHCATAVLAALMFAWLPAWSQEASTRMLQQPTDWKNTEAIAGMIYPFEIHAVGSSIYFRRYDSAGEPIQASPITRIDADGRETSLDLRIVPGAESRVYVMTWFVNPDGSFYALDLFYEENTDWLVSYDSAGKFEWKAKMARVIQAPDTVVPLDGGNLFLVSGTIIGKKPAPRAAISAIFDRSGNLVRDVTLPTDSTEVEVNVAGRTRTLNPSARATVGSDGLVYLMRQATEPRVQVFSSSGDLLRLMDLTSPKEAGYPMDIYADGDQVIVMCALGTSSAPSPQLARANPNILFFDSRTGKLNTQRYYEGVGVPISFRDGHVTFFNTRGDHISVGHAAFN
jgi:hypothetical protein